MTPEKVNELIEFQERAAAVAEGEVAEFYKQTAICLRHYHTALTDYQYTQVLRPMP